MSLPPARGAVPIPLSLAIVCSVFPPGEQARALGVWAAVSAIGLGVGPLVGGGLVDLDWRLIFWINLPISALGFAIVLLAAPESTDPGSGRRIDAAGLLALAAGLTAVVLALVQARVWSAPMIAALGLFGLASLYGFWRIEHRSPDPIVDFSLFRNGPPVRPGSWSPSARLARSSPGASSATQTTLCPSHTLGIGIFICNRTPK
jgi:hypothetical protein